MKISCKELKRISRENLCRRYLVPTTIFLIIWAITGLLYLPFRYLLQTYPTHMQMAVSLIAMVLIGLLEAVLKTGALKMHLCMARRQEYFTLQVFYCFRRQPDRYVLCGLVKTGCFAAALLPALAGILLLFRFQNRTAATIFILLTVLSAVLCIFVLLQLHLLFFIALEQEDMPIAEVIRTSVRSMRGQKGRLFYIYLSFLGMLLLCALSFGLGLLWFIPYEMQTMTNFYLDVIGELPEIRSKHARNQQTGNAGDVSQNFHSYM